MRWLTLLVLLSINVVYVYIGGAIFYLVEGKAKNLVTFNSLIDKVFEGEVVVNRSKLADLVIAAIEVNHHGHLVGPWNNSVRLGILWDYQNSVFFTATIVTSIGYGYLAPRTDAGRYLCLVFASLGIPLFMAFISLLGDKLNHSTDWLTQHGCLKDKASMGKIVRLLFFILVGGGLFLLTPAYCFSIMEGWSLQESIYYGFITLSTIGFGDYVAGTNRSIDYPVWYQVLRTIWIYTGLAWLAMVVRLQQDAIGVFVRARETDVVGMAVKTTRRVHASIMKRLSKSQQGFPTDEDNLDIRSSWLNLFRTSVSRMKREELGRSRGHRRVFRTASAPLYEERSEDLAEVRNVLSSLPPIQSFGTIGESSQHTPTNMSQDVEGGQIPSSTASPSLSDTPGNRRRSLTNQVYVEVHDHFVIECPCELCHNVITVDRQTQISSKHTGGNQASSTAGATSTENGTTSNQKSNGCKNGHLPAILQNETEDMPSPQNISNSSLPLVSKAKSPDPVFDAGTPESNEPGSLSVPHEVLSPHQDAGHSNVSSGQQKSISTLHMINPAESNDRHQKTKNLFRTNSLKSKRALFARSSTKNVWKDLDSMKSSFDDQESGDTKNRSERTQSLTNNPDMDLTDEHCASATNGLNSANDPSDGHVTERAEKSYQRKRTLSETPLCNISQFYKEQVGFFIT